MSEANDPGHGHSPASWTTVIIVLVAFTIGTVAFCMGGLDWVVWGSVALLIVGFIVGWIMRAAGYGVGGSKVKPSTH